MKLKQMKFFGIFLIFFSIFFVAGCGEGGVSNLSLIPTKLSTANSTQAVIITSGYVDDFESGSGVNPDFWTPVKWNAAYSVMTWQPSGGMNNTKCICISSAPANDARWDRTFYVTPGQEYVARVWMKGESIALGKGANLCIEGEWTSSEGFLGTFDWKKVTFNFIAPSSGTVQLGCRLGYWGATSVGKVWFDDLRLFPATGVSPTPTPTPNLGLGDNFELGSGANPDFWNRVFWNTSYSVMTWEPSGGMNNTKCVSITSTTLNDARWTRVFNVTPGQQYTGRVWIKGENIAGGKGANLGVEGTYTCSDGFLGTFDWKKISFNFTPSSSTVEIGCRLGHWGATTTGKVWFDDLKLNPVITPTPTLRMTPTPTPTRQLTPTPTRRIIFTPTPSPTVTRQTPTPTLRVTPTSTTRSNLTPTPTRGLTPTVTRQTPTPTLRVTPTPTTRSNLTPTPTRGLTPTVTRQTPTPTLRVTPTSTTRSNLTPTPTRGLTPTSRPTPTLTPTVMATPTPVRRNTPTPTARVTFTPTPTPSGLYDGLESGSGTMPDLWSKQWWNSSCSIWTWEPSGGMNNSKCVSINTLTANDAMWKRSFNVTPGQCYLARVYVKGENISGGRGANICLYGTWICSDGFFGTFGWKEINFNFKAPSTGVVEIGCRLGYWSGLSTGKVWFDDLRLEPLPMNVISGQKVRMVLESDDLSGITPANMLRWVDHLDAAYNAYNDLVGRAPFGGAKIEVLSVRGYPGGWAVAGNPILWYKLYVRNELISINNYDEWSFGILHEIGHDYDMDNWNWDGEFWANTKMYYVVETLNGKVKQSKYYTGTELKQYYYQDAGGSYTKTIAQGIFSHDALTYCFIRIREAVGWEPFKQTFRYFASSGENPATIVDKFNRFLQLLQQYYNPGGHEVENTFPAGELAFIRANIN